MATVGSIVTIKKEEKEKKDPRLKILYEDENFIAADKPAGLLSVMDASKEETMYQIVSHYVKSKNRKQKIFVLHRLDRETSGVLLFSKNEKLKYQLQADWNSYVKTRSYIAIIEGTIKQEEGTITSYLTESKNYYVHSTKQGKDAKLAITHYKKIKEEKGYTWLNVTLETGRKNQIRVHMKELGHPIAGDKKYGAKTNPFKRLALHANLLEFTLPKQEKKIRIESPLPNSLKRL